MKRMPVLHGGECHRTSATHKSGNKRKNKRYKLAVICKGNELRSKGI